MEMARPVVDDIVWIPAVPLPLMGGFTDRCGCGKRFRAVKMVKRRRAYEVHWRLVHEPEIDPAGARASQGVTRAEAEEIYKRVEEARAVA